MTSLIINTRCLRSAITGVQRYTTEVLQRLKPPHVTASPSGLLRGHIWEQCVLPQMLRHRLLWSPANTGPLSVARQVVTIHDIATIDHPEWFSFGLARAYRLMLPRLLPRVQHIITVSSFTKRRLIIRFGIPDNRISVIHPGVDKRFLSAQPMLPMALRNTLTGHPFVLIVGSLDPRKNLGRLVSAWHLIRKRLGAAWRLVIAGGANSRIFASLDDDLNGEQVIVAGRISDEELPGLYAAAHVFAYPSLYEGFGLPPLEAMATGIPVVTSTTTSLPEVAGDACLLVDPFSVTAIAEGIFQAATDSRLRERLSIAGRLRAACFTWDDCAHSIGNVLEQVSAAHSSMIQDKNRPQSRHRRC